MRSVSVIVGCALAVSQPALSRGAVPSLLPADGIACTVTVAWTTDAGPVTAQVLGVGMTSSEVRTPVADGPGVGLEVFVAAGGSRLDVGAGDPTGAVLRFGVYKADPAAPFFPAMTDGGWVLLRARGFRFASEAELRPRSIIQHVKYTDADLAACGLGREMQSLYNTANATDDLRGRMVNGQNARLGVFELTDRPLELPPVGSSDTPRARLAVDESGEVLIEAVFPYVLLRHSRDPWRLSAPGTFFEPYHFHLEFEAVPRFDGAGDD